MEFLGQKLDSASIPKALHGCFLAKISRYLLYERSASILFADRVGDQNRVRVCLCEDAPELLIHEGLRAESSISPGETWARSSKTWSLMIKGGDERAFSCHSVPFTLAMSSRLIDVDLCRAARLVAVNARQKLSVKAMIFFARRKSMMWPKPIEYFAVTLSSASPFLDCDPCTELFVSCAGAAALDGVRLHKSLIRKRGCIGRAKPNSPQPFLASHNGAPRRIHCNSGRSVTTIVIA